MCCNLHHIQTHALLPLAKEESGSRGFHHMNDVLEKKLGDYHAK